MRLTIRHLCSVGWLAEMGPPGRGRQRALDPVGGMSTVDEPHVQIARISPFALCLGSPKEPVPHPYNGGTAHSIDHAASDVVLQRGEGTMASRVSAFELCA